MLHADFFRSFLPPTTHFGAIGDAGWFRPDVALDHRDYTKSIATMWSVANCSSSAGCAAANPTDPSACGFAANVFPHLKSEMFVMEGAYDSWQLGSILGLDCASYVSNRFYHACVAWISVAPATSFTLRRWYTCRAPRWQSARPPRMLRLRRTVRPCASRSVAPYAALRTTSHDRVPSCPLVSSTCSLWTTKTMGGTIRIIDTMTAPRGGKMLGT